MLPRVRTIVFRSFLNAPTAPGAPSSKTETLEFITDRRSRKCNQLLEHSAAELSWYFPRTREQFRVAGQLKLVGADADEYGMGHMLEARLRRWKVRAHAPVPCARASSVAAAARNGAAS